MRSGSKVGSRGYKSMIASTNDAYCPTLRRDHQIGAARRRELGARDRARRPGRRRDRRRHARRHRRRLPPRRRARSPPATTAASSARTTSICARSWPARRRVSGGRRARLRAPLDGTGRLRASVLAGEWIAALSAAELAAPGRCRGQRRQRALGDLFAVAATPPAHPLRSATSAAHAPRRRHDRRRA